VLILNSYLKENSYPWIRVAFNLLFVRQIFRMFDFEGTKANDPDFWDFMSRVQTILVVTAIHIDLQCFNSSDHVSQVFSVLCLFVSILAIVKDTIGLENFNFGETNHFLVVGGAMIIGLFAIYKLKTRIAFDEHVDNLFQKIDNQQIFKLVLDNFHEPIIILTQSCRVGYSNENFFFKFHNVLSNVQEELSKAAEQEEANTMSSERQGCF